MSYKAAVFIKALANTGGIIKNAAETIGCSRQTVYNAIKKYPTVAKALDEEREKLKDLVEERLIEQIQLGNMTAIIWYSKTQMKDRGYVERPTQQQVNINLSDLTEEELRRVADGEDPVRVLSETRVPRVEEGAA